jgi:hypothetical protein
MFDKRKRQASQSICGLPSNNQVAEIVDEIGLCNDTYLVDKIVRTVAANANCVSLEEMCVPLPTTSHLLIATGVIAFMYLHGFMGHDAEAGCRNVILCLLLSECPTSTYLRTHQTVGQAPAQLAVGFLNTRAHLSSAQYRYLRGGSVASSAQVVTEYCTKLDAHRYAL